jgi:hypothetical protein
MNYAPRGIQKYYLGLGVLAVFTVVLVIVLLAMAGGSRQDAQTYKKANQIADKLNSYTGKNYKAPNSLDAVGVKDVPDTITYTRLSSTSYKFCATYKASQSSASIAESDFTAYRDLYTGNTFNGSDSAYYGSGIGLDASTYHKGENCQTVDVGLDNIYNGGGPNCGTPDYSNDQSYQNYLKCYDDYYNSQNTNSI